MTNAQFPPGFLWGVATSAHQIEGSNHLSDWWAWEEQKGRIKNGEKSGRAADHWNRVEEDVGLLKNLNCNAYRFSVEWARLEPRPGEWDAGAFSHYRKEIALLRAARVTPMITLHHFTSPQWLAERGGWEWDGAPEAFERFSAKVFEELGEDVDLWVTFNEPMVLVVLGYLGLIERPFPPGKNDPKAALKAMRGLLSAHAAAYRTLHASATKQRRKVRIGLAHHFHLLDVKGFSPLNHLARKAADLFFNWSFPMAVETGKVRVLLPGRHVFPLRSMFATLPGLAGSQDFVGVNYYTRDFIRFGMKADKASVGDKNGTKTDVGWEIYPEGIFRVLTDVTRWFPDKPILITENGLADASDRSRTRFLVEHLREVSRAIKNGSKVEGYFHWSLLDNFEWVDGFEPRFGLFEVDYKTMSRRPRPSARAFARIAAKNGFLYPFEI